MRPLIKTFSVDSYEFFRVHFGIVSVLLPDEFALTPTEINIMSSFMDCSQSGLVTTGTRKLVRGRLKLSESNLSNHLKRLKEKKYIIEEAGDLRVNPKVVPSSLDRQEYKIAVHVNQGADQA